MARLLLHISLWFHYTSKVYFTNIPLLESIDLAVNFILLRNSNIKLSKDNLKELFLVATAQTHFLFQEIPWATMKKFSSNNTMSSY